MATQATLLHPLIKSASSSRCKTISQQNAGLWQHTSGVSQSLHRGTIPAVLTTSAPHPAVGTQGQPSHPTAPSPQSQLSAASSALTLQQAGFSSPGQKNTFKKQLKLTEFRACTLILKHRIGCKIRAGQDGGAFCVCPSEAQQILTTAPT